MFFRTLFILYLISHCSGTVAQERRSAKFGEPTEAELALKVYDKDTTASAVVLFEKGTSYFETVGDYIRLIKTVYRKVKIFDSKNFDGATVEIPLMTSNGSAEKVTRYNALTHNGPIKTYVAADAIFNTRKPGVGKVCRIVFPNVQDGSIIEYWYKIESPFFFNLNGWEFQGELPRIYSEYISAIPANFKYKSLKYGEHPFYFQSAEIERDCFRPAEHYSLADCETSIYTMTDVPAFQKEAYMLSARNYLNRIEYEPVQFIDSFGEKTEFSNSWEEVDKFFKKDDNLGKQLRKSNYFKRRLPDSIFSVQEPLAKAKAIYSFIQSHYTWDGRWYNSQTRVKDAFAQKTGSVAQINLSLINALNAVGLDANLVLLSTREHGLAPEDYPVLTKFNYTIAFLKIDGQGYFLDATDRQASFGIIPYRALNMQGRVMDFKNGSYWEPLEPSRKNIHYVNADLTVTDTGDFTGRVHHDNYGYIGLAKRNSIEESTLSEYMTHYENDMAGREITDLKVGNVEKIDLPLSEDYQITLTPEKVGTKVILQPFFYKTYISENPFTLESRNYPIDFGFPFTNTYLVGIDLKDVYSIEQIPTSRTMQLPNNNGECSISYSVENSKIQIRFNLKLNSYRFVPEAQPTLKEFFSTAINMLKAEPIILKKSKK